MKLLHAIIGLAAALSISVVMADSVPLKTYNVVTDPIFNSRKPMTASTTPPSPRLATLDVMGIGLTVEKFRQGQAWDALQKHMTDSILPSDLSTYETNRTMKDLISKQRAANALEYGASNFIEYWPIPSVSVWSFCDKREESRPGLEEPGETNYSWFYNRVDDLRMPAGMHGHEIASLGSYFLNDPEDILERAFRFFEINPEVPALLLLVSDGDQIRASTGDKSRKPYWIDGPRKPDSMTESFVVLVLARRERVDQYLRPFAWHSKATDGEEYDTERDAHAKLMQNKTAKGSAFKASKFLPFPWSDMQIQQFDALPTIAVLHRPIHVTYRNDKDGKPTFDPKQKARLMSPRQKKEAFQAGFDTALHEIPGNRPARVLYDTGGGASNKNVVPLSLAVENIHPEFDLFDPHEGYEINLRIGNTGAASPFVQWALASMATFQKKDASITVNLRQQEEATITVVTPSTDTQQHPMGHPFNFNLAPQDGGPAVPVAPPVPVKPHASNSAAPPPSRTIPLGLSLHTGDTCPITGVWQCDPPDDMPAAPAPLNVAAPKAVRPTVPRAVALGARLSSGDECNQSGMWKCDPPDAEAGAIHFLSAGRTLPKVTVARSLTKLQKIRRHPSSEKVAASWTLLSYDTPTAQ
jgi:hypothetical protein